MSTKLVVGNKYVPHQKTAYGTGLESSGVWKRAQKNKQPYLYYLGTNTEGYRRFSDSMDGAADYFNEDDVTPYDKIQTVMSTQAISRKNLQTIHSKVCGKWQSRIEEKLKADLFSDNIEVENGLILQAFEEADESQRALLSKYFKTPSSEYMALVEDTSSFDPNKFPTDHIQIGNTAVGIEYKGRSIIFDPSEVEAIIMDNPQGNNLSKMIVFKTR
jgi:hypothetical protein